MEKYNIPEENSLDSIEATTIQQVKKEDTEDYTPRTIPEWKIKGNLELRTEDQSPAFVSKLSEEDFGALQFYCPCTERQRYSYTESAIVNQLKNLRKGVRLLSADCINDLLSFSDKFPDNWKGRNIQLWGSVYRDNKGRVHIKYLYYDDENELWLVGDKQFGGRPSAGVEGEKTTGEKSLKELLPPMIHPEDKWYIPFLDSDKPAQS